MSRSHSPHTFQSINNDVAVGRASLEGSENLRLSEAVNKSNQPAGNLEMEKVGGNLIETGRDVAEEGNKREILKPEEAAVLPEEQDEAKNQEMEYESFINGILGCLNELRNSQDGFEDESGHGDGTALVNPTLDDSGGGAQRPGKVLHSDGGEASSEDEVLSGDGDEASSEDEALPSTNGSDELGKETTREGNTPPKHHHGQAPVINGFDETGLGDRANLLIAGSEGSNAEVKLSSQTCNGDDCGGLEGFIAAEVEQSFQALNVDSGTRPQDELCPGISGLNDLNAAMTQPRQISNVLGHKQNILLQNNASTHFDSSSYLIRVYLYSYLNHSEVSPLANWTVKASEVDRFLKQVETSIPQSQRRLIESDLQLPLPQNLRKHRRLAKSAQRFELGTSGYSYEGEIMDKKMHGYGRLVLGDSRMFIEGKWSKNQLIELKFCQFTFRRRGKTIFIVRRLDDYLLTVYENNFVARVMIGSVEELDFTASVSRLVNAFFGKLTTLEILVDELESRRQASLNKFESVLKNMVGEDVDPVTRANILVLLSKSCNVSDLLRDQTIPAGLREAATELRDSEIRYLNDSFMMSILHKSQVKQVDLRKTMSKIYREGIERHREMLFSKCPSALPSLLAELRIFEDSKIVYVTRADIAVFDHLVSQPGFEHCKEFVEDLVERFCQVVYNLRICTPPSSVIPVMSPVYGFLFKSFWEIISEIIEVAEGYQYKDMLKCESGVWKLEDDIKWPEGENDEMQTHGLARFFRSSVKRSSLRHRSLEIQYKFIFQMLKHFSPENYAVNKKCLFKFEVLEQDLWWWQKSLKMVKKNVGLARRLKNVPEERIVWLYMLDHTIHNVLKDDPKYHILLKPYKALLQGQISFIEKSQTESHESFRVLTHSIVRFVTSTAPYFRDTRGKPGVDVEILVQQMWTFSTASQDIEQDPSAFSSFRDLIAEYNRYLSLRLLIDIEAAPGYFSSQISEMMKTFMRIVKNSLNKKSVPTSALVGYFRSLNDFLDDFRNIDFLALWFVKSMFYDPAVMEKVDNKLSTSVNCSYRVIDIEKYVQKFTLLRHQPPTHYIILIVHELLKCVNACLSKQWQSEGDGGLQIAQLKSASVLLDAVRRSFMYLKEQPDYVDFKAFREESVDPFAILVNECTTLNDLNKRIDIVKESFWYIRKMDEIGIDQALMLFKNANTCQDSDCDKLLECYKLYLSHYDEYISLYSSSLSEGKSHAASFDAVRDMLPESELVKPLHFSKWSEEFKTRDIPILLAALSAVWSIMVSKDVSSAGKFLKPHCIQILCVMRLLSVDRSKGADNHLAQVLTGQGKSVILGLLSSVLALTGHKVRVLCYSTYLSSRDQNDFEEFFEMFRITDKINYGTFEDMADVFLRPVCNGIQTSLRELVKNKVLNPTGWSSLGSVTTDSKDTVLLIDEVDVFFSDKFYGSSYGTCVTIKISGLAAVQEKIWSLATTGNFPADQIVQLSKKHIADEVTARNPSILGLNAFLNKPGTFSLLDKSGDDVFVTQYTRQSLFDEHLLRMATCALSVARSSDDDWVRLRFIINGSGLICCKREDNIYSETCLIGYCNVFNYFRLKGSNYDSKNSRNYGYLKVDTGKISYARLPSQFKLILGVSGTITDLGEYEKRGIKSYKIYHSSILPSFFGVSNLIFNDEADFRYFHQVQEWLKEIYKRASQIVESRRAVLIFFVSDSTVNLFTKEYKGKFDRLNEITANTDGIRRDVCIEEAGLSCTVTLATRDMGRGVDYKSSLSVEKNGGVHVIQTFYSVDVKEEIQIRGRTARKDNKGSYELMICRQHLIEESIIANGDLATHNYSSLNNIRRELSDKKGKTLTEKIEQSERNHITTMKYFGLA